MHNYYVTSFLNATDRRGRQLYPGARIVIWVEEGAVVEWLPWFASQPVRTVILPDGTMEPGVCGDAQHVGLWMAKKYGKDLFL